MLAVVSAGLSWPPPVDDCAPGCGFGRHPCLDGAGGDASPGGAFGVVVHVDEWRGADGAGVGGGVAVGAAGQRRVAGAPQLAAVAHGVASHRGHSCPAWANRSGETGAPHTLQVLVSAVPLVRWSNATP